MRTAAKAIAILMLAATAAFAESEPELWTKISTRYHHPVTITDGQSWFDANIQSKRTLLNEINLYHTLYPGGDHRDEAIQLEMVATFEIAVLEGGDLTDLATLAKRHADNSRSDFVRYESAYWLLICELSQTHSTSTPQPRDTQKHLAYQKYVEKYPKSQHTPRIVASLFHDAHTRGARGEMKKLVSLLQKYHPTDLVTESLAARLSLIETAGRKFPLKFENADFSKIKVEELAHRPLLIVVWATFSPESVTCMEKIRDFQAQHKEIAVVGINLDVEHSTMIAQCNKSNIHWPQVHDGLGWGTWFVKRWGIRQTPFVLVIDANGTLVATADEQTWRESAEKCVTTPSTPNKTPLKSRKGRTRSQSTPTHD